MDRHTHNATDSSILRVAACVPPNDEKIKAYNEASTAFRAALDKFKSASASLRSDTETITESLKKINFNEAMVGQFTRVVTTLKAGVSTAEGRLAAIRKPLQEMNEKLLVLEAAYAPFESCANDDTAPPAVRVVVADMKSKRDENEEQQRVVGSLLAAVKGIPDKANEFLRTMAEKATGAAVLRATLPAQTLRTQLAEALPDLALALKLRRLFEPVTKEISAVLDPKFPDLKGVIQKPDFKGSLANVDAVIKTALAKVPGWSDQASTNAQEQYAGIRAGLSKASADTTHSTAEVLALATEAEKARAEFNSLADALHSLVNETQRDDTPATALPDGFIPTGASAISMLSTGLQRMVGRFAGTVLELKTGLVVDKSTWSMASVDLFYFDNVERLMRVLSPNVRLITNLSGQDFQGAANTARTRLNEASQDLENAESEVSDRRQEVADLQERLRLATTRTNAATQVQRTERNRLRRDASAAEARERALTERRKDLDARKALAQRQLDRANTAATAKPDDPDLQRRVDVAQRELDRITLQADEAKADEERAHDDAVAARSTATGGVTDVDADVTELREQLSAARTALDGALTRRAAATTTHRNQLRSAFLAAQAENFAFAQARDNAPFLTTLPEIRPPANPSASPGATPAPTPLDTDPISRVLLFAFPDTRTIFIRGPRDDIDLVRQIIKEFDQPAGQAMMTLRTLEINSDGSPDGAKRALRFLRNVDDKLRAAQANVEAALSNVRDQVNIQVKDAAGKYRANLQHRIEAINAEIRTLQAQQKTADAVRNGVLQNVINDKINQRDLLVQRRDNPDELEALAFYDPNVLAALGWRDTADLSDARFLNAVIPSPSRSVNLAQALISLALASSGNRKAIVDRLKPKQETNIDPTQAERQRNEKPKPDPFASLRRFVGSEGNAADIVGFQTKLVEALRFNGITHVLELAEAKVRLRLQLERDLTRLQTQLDTLGENFQKSEQQRQRLSGELTAIQRVLENPERRTPDEISQIRALQAETTKQLEGLKTELLNIRIESAELKGFAGTENIGSIGEIQNALTKVDNDLIPILSWLEGNTSGVPPTFLRRRIEEAIKSTDSTSSLLAQAVGLRRSARFRFSQANESAVNLTFRKYLEQMNRELTDIFVKPTFREINELLIREKLGVGVLQETSILASNRLSARVDPRGSAQLAVGQEQDVLEAAKQLTNLFGLAGKGFATGVTGNPLALAAGPAGGVIQSAQSILGALDQMPRDAAPTVYGIATGNLFQVTPVIDPSGQALRFRFDLVSSTQIREPNDTIDPMLPRIERHSVNTEVHLADQEIRLISQFEANSRLGIPKRKSGGLPILKDLPGVSEVPLIGWFVKRGGRNAQTQQSFIFCQTVMYPTLSEVLDVAVQSPTFTGLEN